MPANKHTMQWDAAKGQWLAGSPIEASFPVGAVFLTVANVNPATLLGVGIWQTVGLGFLQMGSEKVYPWRRTA